LHIKNAFYFPIFNRNLLSFNDIHLTDIILRQTMNEILNIFISLELSRIKKCVLEKLSVFPYGLYYTCINAIETHVIVSQKLTNRNEFLVWHDWLGHPRYIMIRKIVENSCGHPFKSSKYN